LGLSVQHKAVLSLYLIKRYLHNTTVAFRCCAVLKSQAVHGVYLERKRRSIDRLLGNYIKPDGQPVGVPPDLREVSPHAQQLVQLVAGIQSETFTYARYVARCNRCGRVLGGVWFACDEWCV
jgi:hypothetical protein